MRIIGKISVSFATLLSGSYIYTAVTHKEWINFVVPSCLQSQLDFPSNVPSASTFLGSLVAYFPKQFLALSLSDHFYIRNIVQQLLASVQYPVDYIRKNEHGYCVSVAAVDQDFDFKNFMREGSINTFLSLARIPRSFDELFNIENEVVEQGDYEKLKDTLRDLLSFLPTSGQDSCTKWFTNSAFRGGKSAHHLYKTISWGPGDETDLDTITSEQALPLFLKALCKHSEVKLHRTLIVENNGLDLLLVVAQHYSDANTTRLLSRILGNLALDERCHHVIIKKGWIKYLRYWMNSEDIAIRSNSFRALANLDRDGEKGYFYEDGIFVVYPTKQLKCCKLEVDLVFIHGLRGSPFTTWRSSEEYGEKGERTCCWPRDWLPLHVPCSRVILVEYVSELSDWTSKCPLQPEISSIEYRASELMRKLRNAGVGQRPVIWISHSMGGLLVKQLLVDALKNEKFRSLSTKTNGVIFYAVPHKGSDVASLVSGKARFVLRPSSEVKELKKGSELLEKLHLDFLRCIDEGEIDVLSYGETEPARIANRDTLLVHLESADVGVGEFVHLPVNHFNVCKPTSPVDRSYLQTVDFVQKHLPRSDIDDYVTVILF